MQKTDYAYNIRGWLTGLNPTFNTDENDLFGLNLYYNDTTYFAALKGALQYNGNIRAMKWRHKNDVETGYAYQGYGFEYDKLNRLKSGKHGISNAAGIFPAEYLNRYNEDNLKYDNNGNILNLSRTGGYKDVDNLRFGQMDSLKYKYIANSNQLMSISDDASVEGYGYNDVNKDTTDFAYDGNGNLIQYKDKKIKSIVYNYLNLPNKIVFDNADSIVYIYDAVGAKHIKRFFEKGKQKNVEYYVGSIVYETDSTEVTAEKLRFVMNAEGRLIRLKNGSFRNEYFLKDHLGNTRVVFADTLGNGTLAIIQETNYYPFGLAFTGVDLKTEKNKFLYNGKELQTDGDLGMYDYGARFYDPIIGRWHVIDAKAEKYRHLTPYNYTLNNPILLIDPNGKEAEKPIVGVQNVEGSRAIYDFATNLKYTNGDNTFHVFAHSNHAFIQFVGSNGEKTYVFTPKQFDKYMSKVSQAWDESRKNGETILLILHSCNTGANTDKEGNPVIPIGQKISDELENVIVVAPDGKVVTADPDKDEDGDAYEKGIYDSREPGSYKMFIDGEVRGKNTNVALKKEEDKKDNNKDTNTNKEKK